MKGETDLLLLSFWSSDITNGLFSENQSYKPKMGQIQLFVLK